MSKTFPQCNAVDYVQQKNRLPTSGFLISATFATYCLAGKQTAALLIPATAGNGMPYTDHPEPKLW